MLVPLSVLGAGYCNRLPLLWVTKYCIMCRSGHSVTECEAYVLFMLVTCCAALCYAVQGMAERFALDVAGACSTISSLPEKGRPKVW